MDEEHFSTIVARASTLDASRVFHARLKLERADREQRLAVCPTVRAYRLMVSGPEAMRRTSDDDLN